MHAIATSEKHPLPFSCNILKSELILVKKFQHLQLTVSHFWTDSFARLFSC